MTDLVAESYPSRQGGFYSFKIGVKSRWSLFAWLRGSLLYPFSSPQGTQNGQQLSDGILEFLGWGPLTESRRYTPSLYLHLPEGASQPVWLVELIFRANVVRISLRFANNTLGQYDGFIDSRAKSILSAWSHRLSQGADPIASRSLRWLRGETTA